MSNPHIELLFCPRCNGRDMEIVGVHKKLGSREKRLRFQCQNETCQHRFYEEQGRWVRKEGNGNV